jgi:hypothetical protein
MPEPSEPKDYWRERQRAGFLHALLHYSLGERLDMHDHALGVREGGVIVALYERRIGD